MKLTFTFTIILFALSIVVYSQEKNKFVFENDSKKYNEIKSIDSDDYSDLAFLDSIVANKRIIFLGESSHYINDFDVLKFRLIRYLHEKHNFEVVAFEAGVSTAGFTNLIKDKLTGLEMLIHSIKGIWRVKGNCNMMDYFKQNNINIAGIDPNVGELWLNKTQYNYIFNNDELSGNLVELDSIMYYDYDVIKSKYYHENIKPDISKLDSVKEYLVNGYSTIKSVIPILNNLSDFQKKVINKAMEARLQLLTTSDNKNDTNFYITNYSRDCVMAKNLEYLYDSLYPDKKIIVWAHNGHISKRLQGSISIGGHLSKQIMDNSYVLGLFASSGEYTYDIFKDKTRTLKFPKKTMETKLKGFTSKGIFVRAENIPENARVSYFSSFYMEKNVDKNYDGIILLKDVKGTHLIKYNNELECN
jgi:erythromycin esterase